MTLTTLMTLLRKLSVHLRHPAWRPVAVGTVVVLGASLGFVSVVVEDAARPTGYLESERSVAPGKADPVLSYREITARDGADRSPHRTAFQHLVEALPGLTDPVVRDADARQAALSRRSSRRAYDGAPPVIPHAVEERDASSCLACHEHGMVLAGKVAPAISHRPLTACLQCHVVRDTSQPSPAGPELVDSNFVGDGFGGRGKRAFAGAPPTMPHRLLMREKCGSCHGVSGHPGIRTTHPQRLSCQQCHAPDSAQQQLPPVQTASVDP